MSICIIAEQGKPKAIWKQAMEDRLIWGLEIEVLESRWKEFGLLLHLILILAYNH